MLRTRHHTETHTPCRPQTNCEGGQALKRFHRTLAAGWACARHYNTDQARRTALPGWIHFYNGEFKRWSQRLSFQRVAVVPPGPVGSSGPLTEKRDHYLHLMAQGMNNSETCRNVGVSRGTGIRWRFDRTVVGHNDSKRTCAPITPTVQISERFLSEDERIKIADRRAAARHPRHRG